MLDMLTTVAPSQSTCRLEVSRKLIPSLAALLLILLIWEIAAPHSADANTRGRKDPVRVDTDAESSDKTKTAPTPLRGENVGTYLGRVGEQVRAQRPELARVRPQGSQAVQSHEIYDQIGGDDVLITTAARISRPGMDIADNGDIYVAVQTSVDFFSPSRIEVHRSQDGGHLWELWGTLEDTVLGTSYEHPDLHIAEGFEDRVYIAYRIYIPGTFFATVNIAYEDLAAASATFTAINVISVPNVEFFNPTLTSDEIAFSGYFLYLSAFGIRDWGTPLDAKRGIWFARSVNSSATWETPYLIAGGTLNDQAFSPDITYGRNGQIHCAFGARDSMSAETSIRYRRALNFAGNGISDWEPIQTITPTNDGIVEWLPTIAASHSTNRVAIAYDIYNVADPSFQAGVAIVPSYNGGISWDLAGQYVNAALVGVATDSGKADFGWVHAGVGNPGSWG